MRFYLLYVLLLNIIQQFLIVNIILADDKKDSLYTVIEKSGTYFHSKDLYYGTIILPDGFTIIQSGIDSSAGFIKRLSDGFRIEYDIGYMAGTKMNSSNTNSCTWFRQYPIGGTYCSMGMLSAENGQKIITTFYDPEIRLKILHSKIRQLEQQAAKEKTIDAVVQKAEKYYKEYYHARINNLRKGAPANFEANVSSNIDLLDYMLVVTSYRPYREEPRRDKSEANQGKSGSDMKTGNKEKLRLPELTTPLTLIKEEI